MRITTIQLAVLIFTLPAMLRGQLYLITGTPTANYDASYESDIFRVGEGTVKQVAEIVPQKIGTEWTAISYDLRKAVILTLSNDNRVYVVDLDKAAVAKVCAYPQVPNNQPIEQWLADVAGRGPTFEWFVWVGTDPTSHIVQGMILDPSVPCEGSFMKVQPFELRYLTAHGNAGIADILSVEGTDAHTLEDGRLTGGLGVADQVDFGYKIPAEFRKGLSGRLYSEIIINTSQILAVSISDGKQVQFLAFRKADKSWHILPPKSELYNRFRGFGEFIAITEVQKKKEVSAQNAKHPGSFEFNQAVRDEQSAGGDEWRKAETSRGPNMEARFEYSQGLYPGRLDVYDLATEKLYTITTNQGDSEILLIEDGSVYYRVSDRLYSAPMSSSGIGSATLLATDEAIRDAHWAFIKH
jgi:hypothetical protein